MHLRYAFASAAIQWCRDCPCSTNTGRNTSGIFIMSILKSICVYCGSSPGASPVYADAARAMARAMVNDNIDLVYGGGKVGLMGIIADEVLRLGGKATGVIPQALMDKEVGHGGLTHLHVVKDMHERKAMMAELADGFIAMPGGMGTLEELFEMLTWSQLGFHGKPIGVLNVDGFYDGLVGFVQHLVTQGFLRTEHASLMMDAPDAQGLLDQFKAFTPSPHTKWLPRSTAKTLVP
jgi:uncharacterized protein (TIGR00730 family)